MSSGQSSGGLESLQKDLIIFLLAALILVALTLFIAWIVWRKCCGKELKEARARRNHDVEADYDLIHTSSTPSAPTMQSFTGPSTSSARSMDTLSSGFGRNSSGSASPFADALLPSYDTVMREHH